MPVRLTPESLAKPVSLVIAEPTGVPFNEKETVWKDSGLPSPVNVAESVVVPPKVPVAFAALRAVTTSPGAMVIVSEADVVLLNTLVAEIVTGELPAVVGVPAMTRVVVLMPNPAGRPVALYERAQVAPILYEN